MSVRAIDGDHPAVELSRIAHDTAGPAVEPEGPQRHRQGEHERAHRIRRPTRQGAWQNDAMPTHDPARIPAFLYGTAWKEERTGSLTELALRMGFRGIDTANQRKHYFEAGVGHGLAAAYRAGVVTRADLFLQTKFTYLDGQDDRLPYDPSADLSTQVAQSMASSLEHLGTDHVDSYVLHGPASGAGWTDEDAEVWAAMAKERAAGRTRLLGVSNCSLRHLEQMAVTGAEAPAFVQNRCFARRGWDRDVRTFSADRSIIYQGFSLLTANREVLRDPLIVEIAAREGATPAQVVFRFALAVGMLPLTGTSDAEHMKQDLTSHALTLSADEAVALESLVG
jgi:diketogulonate reductase-like aldo/keto reductase